MNLSQLKSLAKYGESDVLEFKKTTGQRSEAMRKVCAFLNSEIGGTVLFGVSDNGQIIGQAVTDDTKRDIAHELRKIEPHVNITVKSTAIGTGKHVIALIVKSGKNKPYSYDGRAYMRNQSTTLQMPREVYIQLLQDNQQQKLSWDKLTTNKCTLNDLDKKRIREIVHLAVQTGRMPKSAERASIPEILQKLDLLNNEQSSDRTHDLLTNAAVILFCKAEKKQFRHAEIRLARFDGVTKSVILDQKDLRGNVFDLFDGAMKYLTFSLPIAGKFVEGNPYRIDTPAIPFDVLREGILNALIHRDYSVEGSSIDVAIYDDRVEIDNPGRLPQGLSLHDLTKKHKSVRRNQLIAEVLFVCGMIERWGRGTLEMIEICKKAGNPVPKFEQSTGFFSVSFPFIRPISRPIIPIQE
jgi:ATP-dependent DNA helicase RecG